MAAVAGPAWMIAPAAAQSAPPAAPATAPAAPKAPAAPDADPLAGPRIADRTADALSIIKRDDAGRITLLDVAPAEAAVRAIKLDDVTRAKVDRVLRDHAVVIDRFVADNLSLLVEAAQSRAANREHLTKALDQLRQQAGPLRDRGMLGQQLNKVLAPDQQQQVRQLVADYWKALNDERESEAKARNQPLDRGALTRELVTSVLGGEVRRSYDRVVGQQARDFDALLKHLNLTPEQEGKVRQIVGDSFQQSEGKVSPAERARLFAEVWKLLDPPQRDKLRERASEHAGRPTPSVMPAVKPTSRPSTPPGTMTDTDHKK